MVRQGAPGEESFWSVPSGRIEDGELITEGLAREVLEEMGLEVVDPGRLAFVLQIDNLREESLHRGRGPAGGYFATVWTFEVREWRGELGPRDPDGVVIEARFIRVVDAVARLAELEWQAVTTAYLQGAVKSGSLHLQRWHPDGRVELVALVNPTS